MKIGAHVSSSKAVELSFGRIQEIEGECFQIFLSPPQRWLESEISDSNIEKFLLAQKETGIGPNFIHGTYLINLGAESAEHLEKSISWLRYSLKQADKLGITGVIFHLGSHKGAGFDKVQNQVTQALKRVLDQPTKAYLILETSAGAGGNIGTLKELGQLLKTINDPRLKVCLDTAHIFSAGNDLRTRDGLELLLNEFEREIGIKELVVIHANDSKADLGTKKDRHENIGQGYIGIDGFRNILGHPKLNDLPFILEVPGFQDLGPDKENVEILKSARPT